MTKPRSNRSLMTGQRIRGYYLDDVLGQGAHGVVYIGHRVDHPGSPLAIKVVDAAVKSDALFLEPEILSQLKHRSIVQLQDYFVHARKLVLVMEYIQGGTLDEHLKDGDAVGFRTVREFLHQIGSALDLAARNNIVHGDIKPSNILVTKDKGKPRFVLTDFGVSQFDRGIQTKRKLLGTYHYMAPEQIRGRATRESDFWALGVVAYQMISGRRPFDGGTVEALRRSICFATPLAPRRDPQGYLDRTIRGLLAKDPNARISTYAALTKALGEPRRALAPVNSGTSVSSWRSEATRSFERNLMLAMGLYVFCAMPHVLSMVLFSSGAFFIYRALITQEGRRRFTPLAFAGCGLGVVGILVAIMWPLVGENGSLLLLGQILLAFVCVVVVARKTKRWIAPWRVIVATAVGMISWLTLITTLALEDPKLIEAWKTVGVFFIVIILTIATSRLISALSTKRTIMLSELAFAGNELDARIRALRGYVDSHYGDVRVHLAYARELFAAGQVEDSLVESRLILKKDPHNFEASLLLAHACKSVGLYDDCKGLCVNYLSFSPQCFEFRELLSSLGPANTARAR